jgi:AhpD family alkylhydroperoxidase
MSATLGARRIAMDQLAPRPFAEMLRLEKAIDLDERVRHLVTVRASQVNGCAFCIDMHWKEARAAGERLGRGGGRVRAGRALPSGLRHHRHQRLEPARDQRPPRAGELPAMRQAGRASAFASSGSVRRSSSAWPPR